MKTIWKRLLILPPLAIGGVLLAWAILDDLRTARVIEVEAVAVVPRAVGHGLVRPRAVWSAVAEVPGRIVEKADRLAKGAVIKKGTVLFRLDPVDHALAIAEAEADIKVAEAELRELEINRSNLEASREIERRALALGQRELTRKRELAKRGTLAKAALDAEERGLLALQQKVRDLDNQLRRLPAQRDLKQARRLQAEARLERARRDLARSEITAPFDLRIAEVDGEVAEFVAAGAVLATGDAIDVAEVTAQFAPARIRNLIAPDAVKGPVTIATFARIAEIAELEAIVRLRVDGAPIEWPARFDRFNDTVDPETRTIGAIVAVYDSYGATKPGIRPPLIKGFRVEVELRGTARPALPVVPRDVLDQGHVLIVDGEGRLRRREIEVALAQGGFAAISKGLAPGERVVVSDLVPAIEGMRIDAVVDAELARRLKAEARGEGPLR